MERIVHQLVQGSPEWEAFRFQHDGASEIKTVMGLDKKTSRAQLLRMKATGATKEFSAWVQENVLDSGHKIEALARPFAVEFAGVDGFYPATVSIGRLSASSDGLDMPDETAWECKSLNQENGPIVKSGRVPDEHMPQCQQVLMVTGADRLLFTVSDGTRENTHHVWVEPDTDWFDRIRAEWRQFNEDLANYQHVEVLPAAVATEQPSLPAVVVRMGGALTVDSNLPDFSIALRQYIKTIPERPSTDQEFADCEAACKSLKKAEDALQAAEDNALAGMTDVEAMRRVVAELRALARATRLSAEKTVEARKISIRAEILQEHSQLLSDHLMKLNQRLGKNYMPAVPADFPFVMKGKKTVQSLRDACSQELARAKIAANEVADRIQINLDYLRENAKDYAFLFADTASIVLKAGDDLAALVQSRIMAHQKAEADRLERERAAIAEQERVKAEARARAEKDEEDSLIASIWANARRIEGNRVGYVEKAIAYFEQGPGQFADDPRPRVAAAVADARAEMKMKLQAAKDHEAAESTRIDNERIAQEARDAIAVAAGVPAAAIAPAVVATAVSPMAAMSPKQVSGTLPVATKPTLRLGAINERLGFIVNVNLIVHQLGVEPAETDNRNLPLFHEHQFTDICKALIQHIETIAEMAPA